MRSSSTGGGGGGGRTRSVGGCSPRTVLTLTRLLCLARAGEQLALEEREHALSRQVEELAQRASHPAPVPRASLACSPPSRPLAAQDSPARTVAEEQGAEEEALAEEAQQARRRLPRTNPRLLSVSPSPLCSPRAGPRRRRRAAHASSLPRC